MSDEVEVQPRVTMAAVGRLGRCSSAFSLLHKTAQITSSNILHVCANRAVVRDTNLAISKSYVHYPYVFNSAVYISSSYSICFSVLRHHSPISCL